MPRNPRPSEIANTIERAADYIQTYGWVRGPRWEDAQKGRVPADMIGAVRQVTRSDNTLDWAYNALDMYLFELGQPSPTSWNQMQRDRRKVIRNMRRCANRLRSRELDLNSYQPTNSK